MMIMNVIFIYRRLTHYDRYYINNYEICVEQWSVIEQNLLNDKTNFALTFMKIGYYSLLGK